VSALDELVAVMPPGEAALEESVWVGNVRNHDWVQTPGSLTDLLLRVVTTGASDLDAVFGWPWRLTPGLAQSD
jgi:hypothetical protein